ncbi:MAG: molecular chaperone TorD family protein [Actinomycetia bacterium]|nr:molecular chaperone TorD family protein [Actinomycetes bacterium]
MTEWADEARARQGLYRFIGAALLPPERERLELLASAFGILDEYDLDKYPYFIAWRDFAVVLESDVSPEDLGIEYVRLFGVGFRGTPAIPTESNYRAPNRDGAVASFIASLQAEYRSLGLASADGAEAPDHISTELEVMSHLCGVEADAWESSQETLAKDTLKVESRFVRSHLAVWIPMFASRVLAASPAPFYERATELVHAFVIHEDDYFAAIAVGSSEL